LRYATLQSVDRTARTWIREAERSSRGLSEALAGAVTRAELGAEQHDATIADARDVRARVESVRHSLRAG